LIPTATRGDGHPPCFPSEESHVPTEPIPGPPVPSTERVAELVERACPLGTLEPEHGGVSSPAQLAASFRAVG